MKIKPLRYRGVLLHLSHYDPSWVPLKRREESFDLATGLQALEAMRQAHMNLLVLDVEDGVRYKKHPELARHYSVPMAHLKALCAAAHGLGMEVVPKLNFSKSERNVHDEWMRPHTDSVNWKNRLTDWWRVAEDAIGELVRACKPRRFFHLGMDEDHSRSLSQYVADIKRLRSILKGHGLRAVIWNDSCYEDRDVIAQVHADKSRAAEALLPKDIVQIPWDYDLAHPAIVRRLVRQGFECWVAPGRDKGNLLDWKRAAQRFGARGMLLTNWMKCSASSAPLILADIREWGPLY